MNKKIGRPQLILTESQVRYAMQNSFGYKDAARFLKVDYRTYKRWEQQHIDSETGKTLFQLHSKLGVPLTREKKDDKWNGKSFDCNKGYKERYIS